MKKKLSFEDGLAELEAIAEALERGEMTLDESFAAYERAMKLKKELDAILNAGDEKIRVLTENGEREMRAEENTCGS